MSLTVPVPQLKVRLIWVYVTAFIFIIVIALGWYFLHYRILASGQAIGERVITIAGTNSTNSDLTSTFFSFIIEYGLVIFGLIVIVFWVYVESQKPPPHMRGYS